MNKTYILFLLILYFIILYGGHMAGYRDGLKRGLEAEKVFTASAFISVSTDGVVRVGSQSVEVRDGSE